MRKMSLDHDMLYYEEGDNAYSIFVDVFHGTVSLKLSTSINGSTHGASSSRFDDLLDNMDKHKLIATDEVWFDFFAAQDRGTLKKLINIPEFILSALDNKILKQAVQKYGFDSKQYKALLKLF